MLIEQEQPMNSSTIRKAIYNFSTETLKIEFISGAVYEYKDVSKEIYENFCVAESKGKFLNEHIKNKFEYSQLLNN